MKKKYFARKCFVLIKKKRKKEGNNISPTGAPHKARDHVIHLNVYNHHLTRVPTSNLLVRKMYGQTARCRPPYSRSRLLCHHSSSASGLNRRRLLRQHSSYDRVWGFRKKKKGERRRKMSQTFPHMTNCGIFPFLCSPHKYCFTTFFSLKAQNRTPISPPSIITHLSLLDLPLLNASFSYPESGKEKSPYTSNPPKLS